jgi:hypothetical protein
MITLRGSVGRADSAGDDPGAVGSWVFGLFPASAG